MSLERLEAADMVTPGLAEDDAARLGARLVEEFDGETDAMLAAAWSMGQAVLTNRALGRRTCRICGCWEFGACNPPCWWVAADLCSACGDAGDA